MQGATSRREQPSGGLLGQVQVKLREIDVGVKTWLRQQPAPVEVVLVTASSALQGGAIGALMGTFTADMAATLPTPPPGMSPQTAASLQQAKALSGGPFHQARNFAVMTGVNAGLTCALKRMKGGTEDAQTSMLAAFGSGAVFSVVSGMGGPNLASNAVTTGIFFALVQGGLFKLGQTFSQPSSEDKFYSQTRSMLNSLGLQKYERNFRKGLLSDKTLPLLHDSALAEVRVPPGARLLILDYIERNHEVIKRS